MFTYSQGLLLNGPASYVITQIFEMYALVRCTNSDPDVSQSTTHLTLALYHQSSPSQLAGHHICEPTPLALLDPKSAYADH